MPDNKIVSATIPADKLMNPDSISLKGIVGDRIRDKEREEAEKAAQEKLKDILPELNKVHQMILDEDETDNIINALFDISVPKSGIAPTVGGEIVRAAIQILNRYYNDGDVFFKGYGLETCGGSAQYIIDSLPSVKRRMMGIVEEDFDGMDYEDAIDSAVRFIADELVENPKLFITPNAVDSRDYDASELIENQPRYELSIRYSDIIDDLRDEGIIDDEDIESYITDIIDDQCHSSRDDAEVYADNYGITISELTSDDYYYLDKMVNIWGGLESEYEDRLEEKNDGEDGMDESVNESKDDISYIVYDSDDEVITDFDTYEDALKYAHDHPNVKAMRKITWEVDDGEYYVADVEDIPLTDAIKENKELTEDTINVSPIFIEKRDALADYFGEEGEVRYDKDMDLFILPDGRAYFVYTGDEADQKAKEEVISLTDDMGINAFTPNFRQDIIDNQMVDVDWFDDAMKESYEFYADDIMSEDGEHGNRLFDEMIEEGVISEEDVTEDGELVDGIDLDEKKEEFVEKLCENWDNGVQWYIDNFGEEEFSDIRKENNLYDYDEIAETAVRWDGRGHFLSMYDGDELDIGDDLFAYKYEEGWDWDKADSIHESVNEDIEGGVKSKTFKRDGITYKITKLEDSLGKGGYVARWEDDSDNGLGYNNRGWISFDKKNYVLHNEASKPIKDFMYVISAYDRHPKKSVADKLIATTVSMFGDDAVNTDGASINEGTSTIKDSVVSIVLPYLDTEKNILDVPINFNKEIAPRGYSVWGNIRGSGFFEGDITYKGRKYPFKVENGKLIVYDRYDLYQAKYVGGKEYTKRAAPKINEDTIKTKDGKWANVGKDGKIDSGKFRTKKEADAQRKAMYSNGYKGESLKKVNENTYIDNAGSWYVDGEDNKYYAYKLTNAMTGDIFLIYSTDDKVLMRNVDKIINDITTSDDEDIVGKYDDIGVYIASNYDGFGFGTYDVDEETGEVTINGSPITLLGKESIRF